MADIVKDPSKLTVALLRMALIKYNVPLPDGKARKSVYVDLYQKNLIDRPKKYDFSSDDEVVIVSQKATKQVKKQSFNKNQAGNRKLEDKLEEVEELSDAQLCRELKQIGTSGSPVGPITDTNSRIYQRKLAELLLKAEKAETEEEEKEEEEEEEKYSDDELEKKVVASGDATYSSLSSHLRPRTTVTSTTTETETRRVTRQSLANAARQQQTQQTPVSREGRRICPVFPKWAQILLFFLLAAFIFLVWYNMETLPLLPYLSKPQIESGRGDSPA